MKISKADAEKLRAAVQADLKVLKPDVFLMRKVLGATPIIFKSPEEYLDWKVRLSRNLGVDPFGTAIIGSACIGISLNPDKNYKQFDDSSDIDVAVVSSYHFDIAWRYLRDIGTGRYALDRTAIAALKSHIGDNRVFWGMIATDKILQHLPFGKEWLEKMMELAKDPPISGRDMKIRLHRDTHSLVSYHLSGILVIQDALLALKKGVQ